MKKLLLSLILLAFVAPVFADKTVEVSPGEVYSLSANIGTPPEGKTFGTYSIKWFKDGKAFSSATVLSVTVKGADECGAYSFVFTNAAGSVTSDVGYLNLKPVPPAPVLPEKPTVGVEKKK